VQESLTSALPSLLEPEGSAIAALLFLRVTGLVWVAPLFSSRAIPMHLKAAISVLLVAVLWPTAATAAGSASITPAAVVSELLVGLLLGLAAGVVVSAAEAAGDLLAVQMGLSGANVVDPGTETQLPVLGHFLGLMTLVCLLSVGGHRAILSGLDTSLTMLPVGAPMSAAEGSLAFAKMGGTLLAVGLRIAAPVVAAMTVANAALGIMSRAVPQLNVLAVAFPLQIGIGLLVLGATLPIFVTGLAGWPQEYRSLVADLLPRLAPASQGGG